LKDSQVVPQNCGIRADSLISDNLLRKGQQLSLGFLLVPFLNRIPDGQQLVRMFRGWHVAGLQDTNLSTLTGGRLLRRLGGDRGGGGHTGRGWCLVRKVAWNGRLISRWLDPRLVSDEGNEGDSQRSENPNDAG